MAPIRLFRELPPSLISWAAKMESTAGRSSVESVVMVVAWDMRLGDWISLASDCG
jgi:hypothetical protein